MSNENMYTLEAEIAAGAASGSGLPAGGEAGQLLTMTESGAAWRDLSLETASAETAGVVRVGEHLLVEDGALAVDVAGEIAEEDSRPVSAAAVYAQLGNVEALLQQI